MMSSSHEFSLHFSTLNPYIQLPSRKLHLDILQVTQIQVVHKEPQLPPLSLLFFLSSTVNFQAWNLSTCFQLLLFFTPFLLPA